MKDTTLPPFSSPSSIYLLTICWWGNCDRLVTRTHSAHLYENEARECGLKLSLLQFMLPEHDRGKWFEIEKVKFGV